MQTKLNLRLLIFLCLNFNIRFFSLSNTMLKLFFSCCSTTNGDLGVNHPLGSCQYFLVHFLTINTTFNVLQCLNYKLLNLALCLTKCGANLVLRARWPPSFGLTNTSLLIGHISSFVCDIFL